MVTPAHLPNPTLTQPDLAGDMEHLFMATKKKANPNPVAKSAKAAGILTNQSAPKSAPTHLDTTSSPGELAAAIIARASRKSAPPAVQETTRRLAERPSPETAGATPASSTPPTPDSPAVKAPKVPKDKSKPCECGCGGYTKGGRYLPGHDSKHRAATAGPKELPDCGCGCGAKTKGGRFLPGHDAKFHSAQRKAAKEAEKAQAEQAQAA